MRSMINAMNRFVEGFQRHWLAVIVGILFAYSLLPFAAPALKAAGFDSLAQVIYQPYKLMCHTYGFRSFFLFGDQTVYSRAQFEQASGIDTAGLNGLLASRQFQGNPEMGYKTALCQRDIAIYLAMAIGGVIYSLTRRRASPISFVLLLLIGVVPIGLDGFSQLLSQPPFNFFPYRESDWVLRTITGALFGFSLAWFVFPMIESAVGPQPPAPRMKMSHESNTAS
jgi:uncharacterized membrane protein